MYSNCSSAEDLSIISSTLMVDCDSSADSSGQLTPETKKTSSAENNGLEADNHQIRDTEESKVRYPVEFMKHELNRNFIIFRIRGIFRVLKMRPNLKNLKH
ncbi:Hypothetical protein NTJ_12120 [Nesidiocoris tenuis]|uniref:Uncharacterized protein n=1 Tax=Nesidiocoris tenuis TaxID=355587 RepID=A0ABN7B4Y6_9HEMI|nr:Hypothetical protein NTJ_12120 [Nesidiocoris tenuis]